MKALPAIALATALAAVCALAQAQPVAGREYQELSPARAISTGERIEVIEFFYYGCPVCYEAQPHIAKWLMRAGPGVAMLRVPAVFTESSESFARTFYTLGAMNQIARLHWPLYDNHHFDGKQLNEEKNIVDWIAGNSVDRGRFIELWKSAEVKTQIDAAKKALDTYQVKGVPSFVIDGKYLTSAKMAGGVREMMRVVDQLVERAAAERKK
jgi:protein dithiol oxidoreductase (disulfide-forming)